MMFRKVAQRPNECLLAAACRLADVDYETASDVYHLMHGHAWGDYTRAGVVSTWVEFLETYISASMFPRGRMFDPVRFGDCLSAGSPPTGKSIVIIRRGVQRHAVALLSDGRVYDPMDGHEYPSMPAYLLVCPGWTLETVVQITGETT